MTGSIDLDAGRLRVVKDGRVALDTDAPLARMAPDAAIDLTGVNIVFPDFWKGTFYSSFATTVTIGGTPLNRYGCSTFASPVGQEWGPDQSSPCTLSDTWLGNKPTGANYLEVFVKLTNTDVPDKVVYDQDLMSFVPSGEWIRLEGGSCMVESYGPYRRMFEVIINGPYIVLRRRQSVMSTDGQMTCETKSIITGNRQYFYSGTNAPNTSGNYCHLGALIETKGLGGTDSYKPGGSNACSLDATGIDYRSVWTADIKIIPGRVG